MFWDCLFLEWAAYGSGMMWEMSDDQSNLWVLGVLPILLLMGLFYGWQSMKSEQAARRDSAARSAELARQQLELLESGGASAAEEVPLEERQAVVSSEQEENWPLFLGRLLQAETEEPLPDYFIRFHGPQGEVTVSTDEAGDFEAHLAEGAQQITFLDMERNTSGGIAGISMNRDLGVAGSGQIIRYEHVVSEERQVLRASSGPTFEFAGIDPTHLEIDDLWAELTLMYSDFGGPIWMEPRYARVRGTKARPWVRFGPVERRHGPWAVTLSSEGRSWRSGAAQIGQCAGKHPTPLRLPMTARGTLRVELVDDQGLAPSNVMPFLEPVGRPPFEVIDDIADQPASNGRYDGVAWVFWNLESGTYRLRAHSERHEDDTFDIQVTAHQINEYTAELRRYPSGGDISGTVTSEDPKARPTDEMVLSWDDGVMTRRVQWKDGVGSFLFEDVPARSYTLRPNPKTFHSWSPEEQPLDPPATGLNFHCSNGGEHTVIGFEVTGPNGEMPERLQLTLRRKVDPSGEAMNTNFTSGAVVHQRFPIDSKVEWTIHSPGYVTAIGDGSAFVHSVATRFGPGRFAKVTLELE